MKRTINKSWLENGPHEKCPYSMADFEERVDRICGCAGKFNCECVSVFNQAKRELWGEHNERTRTPYQPHT